MDSDSASVWSLGDPVSLVILWGRFCSEFREEWLNIRGPALFLSIILKQSDSAQPEENSISCFLFTSTLEKYSFTSENMLVLNCRRFSSTIFSLSSGYGKCGVAVVRVSGPKSKVALERMTELPKEPQPRFAYYKNIHFPGDTSRILDKGLVLWFPGKYSHFSTSAWI